MLFIDADRISLFRQPGGVAFTGFLDGLIRTAAYIAGQPDSAVETNVETTRPDGGVDALAAAMTGEPTGFLREPSVWQYKATTYPNLAAAELLGPEFVREQIRQGRAFRLAIADSLSPEQRHRALERLTAECQRISRRALVPMVVTADDLVAWANRYPGYLLRWFHPDLGGKLLHLGTWQTSASDPTPTFVPVDAWRHIAAELRHHVDFDVAPPSAVCALQGEAGVGKSRLVCEILSAIPAMPGLTVYCDDEDRAMDVARWLVNAETPVPVTAVLVADECSLDTRERLRRLLDGHRGRLRAIAIDNRALRPSGPAGELWLEKMSEPDLARVLDENFADVPADRRRQYAELARGYPRLAADLCRHHGRILAAAGQLAPALPGIRDFLHARLPGPERDALHALALVTRIGHSEAVADELNGLAALVAMDASRLRDALREIHRGPGFAAQAGRYFYVTPEIVATVAFEDAWERWIAPDPAGFFSRVPPALVQTFLERVTRSAGEEARRVSGGYFRDWVEALSPEHLTDGPTTHRLAVLVETDPDQHLSRLRRLIESAAPDLLRQVSGRAWNGHWGPRRELVWLVERLAWFPEYFTDCERILLRLAAAESEPDIANNASAVWRQFFRVDLPGTATGLFDRLSRLRERLCSDEHTVWMLAVSAIDAALTSHVTRPDGAWIVGGRLRPEESMPRTRAEEVAAFTRLLSLVEDVIAAGRPQTSAALVSVLVKHYRWLIVSDHHEQARRILGRVTFDDAQRAILLESLDAFLAFDAPRAGPAVQSTVEDVRAWRAALVGSTVSAQLRAIVGAKRWGAIRLRAETEWRAALQALARELVNDPRTFVDELPWLFGAAANGAAELGAEIGQQDSEGRLLDPILASALGAERRDLATGYVRALIARQPAVARRLHAWLDERERDAPIVAAEIAIAAGEPVEAFERVLRLFDRGVVPASLLFERHFSIGGEPVLSARFERLVERLGEAARQGNQDALHVGLDNLSLRLGHEPSAVSPLEGERVRKAAWTLAEVAIAPGVRRDDWWAEIVEKLGERDAHRAAALASRALLGEALGLRHDAERILVTLAARHPVEVMEALGRAVMDEQDGWKFFVDSFKTLVASLPVETVTDWLGRVGVEGARRLARHLPPPRLENGVPVVHSLTAWVLSTFEADERVSQEFCAGVHGFRTYYGDMAARLEGEASLAHAFLDHPLRRVRQWAVLEERAATEHAKRERQDEAERWLS